MKPGIYRNLSFAEYVAIDAVNQSALRPFLQSIRHGEYAMMTRGTPSPAMEFGTAIHTLMLDGEDEFNRQYAVGGPINPKTGESYGRTTKAFSEWLDTQDGLFVTHEEHRRLLDIRDRLNGHSKAGPTIRTPGANRELTIVWDEPVHGQPVRCKARIDWCHPEVGVLDLKSTRDCSAKAFAKSVADYGYHMQAAWYLLGAERVGLGRNLPYGWIAVESAPPYGVGLYTLSDWDRKCGLTRALKALHTYTDWKRGFVTADDEDGGFVDLAMPGWAWEDEKEIEQLTEGYA
jgi:hypothetical protein